MVFASKQDEQKMWLTTEVGTFSELELVKVVEDIVLLSTRLVIVLSAMVSLTKTKAGSTIAETPRYRSIIFNV